MNLLILAAVGAALWLASRTPPQAYANAPSGIVVMIHAGVPYQFVVQLYTSESPAQTQTALHAALTAAGAKDIAFSKSRVAFDIVPKKSDTTTVGSPLTGLGRIERITRLDGKPFTAPP